MRVATIPREVFLAHHFDYQPGEHFGIWSPTGSGKTYDAYQLLDVAMLRNPQLRAASLMPKSRDAATWQWAARLGLRVTDSWPPGRPLFADPPRGHVFWPKHLKGASVAEKRAHLTAAFRAMLNDQFQRGESITLADDVYNLAAVLGLNMELEEFWTAGASAGAGLWSANQKPSGTIGGGHVSSFSYNAPTHYLFGKDTDRRNVRRFAEIGAGVDPELIAYLVANLRIHTMRAASGRIAHISEKLYLHKGGPYLCILGL